MDKNDTDTKHSLNSKWIRPIDKGGKFFKA